MSMGLQPYPEYTDSSLPWLGPIPAHWHMVRMKHLFRELNVRGYPDEPLLAATQTKGVVRKEDYGSRTVLATKDLHNLKLVRVGDFVISLRSFQGGIEYARHQGIISQAYTVICPVDQSTLAYFGRLLKSRPFINGLTVYVTGIRQGQNIDYAKLSRSPLPLPPPEEQDAIVAYVGQLDHRVSHFIRNRQRLIEVLNEQKQAVITRAVTRGLDPEVRLKPSGINWLGSTPEHWKPVRLKHVSRVQTGITLGKDYLGQAVEERPYLRVANVQTGHLNLKLVKTVAVPRSEIVGTELTSGDVLMTEGGDIDKLGRGCIWQGEIEGCLHQNHIFAVRADQRRLLPDYLAALMASRHGRVYFQLTAKRTTNLASTNSSTLGALPMLLPEIEEQRRILDYIANEASPIDAATDHVQREITLIREYRTRLIADAVTGKVDVRHLAPEAVEADSDLEDFEESLGDEMPEADEMELVEEVADADD